MDGLGVTGFLLRWLAAILLVGATYNPTGTSFVHWIAGTFPKVEPPQAVAGIVLLAGWVFFVRSTWAALGAVGVLLGIAFFAAVTWLFVSWGWLSLADTGIVTWATLGMLSFLLAIGLSWSHVRRRVTGQSPVDELGPG
ncbi:MAG: DUF6524 family protein [Steroidobacteraceae bacterium]|jgi:hypothetical protein|nr:DUF6524 family protein [Steroidobacteraceae bacterium]